MRNKFDLIFLLIGIIFFLFPKDVFAHILQTDGTIGAVLHIDPEDDPIVGKPATFYFEFKDKIGRFIPDKCDCTVSIINSGKSIYTQSLFQSNTSPDLSNASFSYTFPKKGVYILRITGKPYTPNAFQTFSLSYDLRISREETNLLQGKSGINWFSDHLNHVIVFGVASFFCILFFINRRNKKQ